MSGRGAGGNVLSTGVVTATMSLTRLKLEVVYLGYIYVRTPEPCVVNEPSVLALLPVFVASR